jgi:hypothetical protein
MGEQAEPGEIVQGPQLPADHAAGNWPKAWFRPLLALTMVAVATLGAATAYWGAKAEHEAISLKLRMTMGRMIELARWAEYAQQYAAWTNLANDSQEHRNRGKALAERANLIRDSEPVRSRILDLQAQEEFALARVFHGYTYFLKRPDSDPKVSISDSLARDVEGELRGYGFDVESPKPASSASKSGAAPTGSSSHAKTSEAPPPTDPMWKPLKGKIVWAHDVVRYLAGGVALFVLALVAFTFADVFSRHYRIAIGLATLGVLIAVGATVGAVIVHLYSGAHWRSWASIIAIYVVLGIAAGLAWRMGLLSAAAAEGHGLHADDVDARANRIAHLFLRHGGSVQSKVVIGLIAVAVLFSALTGTWYAIAATEREHFALDAFNDQVALAERISQSAFLATSGAFEPGVDLLKHRVRCASAVQREALARADPASYSGELSGVRRMLACEPLEEKQAKSAANIVDDGYRWDNELSPRNYLPRDALAKPFRIDSEGNPGRYIYHALYHGLGDNPSRLAALADGHHALSAAWNERATVYLACLTLFAIALYLFGQGLGVGQAWQSQTFVAFGMLFMLVGFGWALLTWLDISPAGATRFARSEIPPACDPPAKADHAKDPGVGVSKANPPKDHAPEERNRLAAKHFGDGEGYLNTAAQLDPSLAAYGYRKAIEALECAVAARPGFPRAHALLERTYGKLNSPQAGEAYNSLPTRSKLSQILIAQEKAHDAFVAIGLVPPRGIAAHDRAFNHLLLALLNGDKDALDSAIGLLCGHIKADGLPSGTSICRDRGPSLARNKTHSVHYLNLALALLGSDRAEEAMAVYKLVVGEFALAENKELTAATLTDLNLFREFCRTLRSPTRCRALEKTVAEVKQMLVAGSVGPVAPAGAKLSNVSIWATASEVGFRGNLDVGKATASSPRPESGKLTVIWYALEPESTDPDQWRVWRAMPHLSRTIEVSKLERGSDGSIQVVEQYFRDRTDCLPAGTYRPEIYFNGVHFRDLDLKPIELKRSSVFRSRELNLTFCQPETWTVSGSEWKPELVRVLGQGSGQSRRTTAVLASYYAPRGEPAQALQARYLDRLVRTVVAPIAKIPIESLASATERILGSAVAFEACGKPPVPKSRVMHKSWVTSEGFVHVALVVGDETEEQCRILGSVKNFYPPETFDKRP